MSGKQRRVATKAAAKERGSKERGAQAENSLNALFERIRAEYPSVFGSTVFNSWLLKMNEAQREYAECAPQMEVSMTEPLTHFWIVGMENKPQFTLISVPVLAEGTPEEAGSALDSAVKECAEAVTRAHEQIERNRGEIERLGEETRDLISKMMAA